MHQIFKRLAIPYRFRVLALLCGLTTLTYMDRICISIVGVRIKADMHLSNEQFGWVLAAFALAYALFEIPSGMLGDRIGPKKVFIRIVIWWSFFTALTGIVGGLVSLLVVRFLFGMGESGTYPNSILTVSRWFPAKEMGKALSWVGIGSQIGAALAPLIIVPIAIAYGWRVPFFVIGAIGLIWVAVCWAWFRDFPALMKAMPAAEKELIAETCRHNDHQRQVHWKLIFTNRTLWPLMLMYFCCQWANYFFIAWMPVYLQEGRGLTENGMKQVTSLLFIMGIAGFLAGGAAGDWLLKLKGLKMGRRLTGMPGLGCCGVLLFIAAFSPSNTVMVCCLVGANFSFSFGVMVSYAVCADIGRNNAGTVTGAMNFFGQMGAFFLALIFGKIVQATHHFDYPVYVVAAVLIAGCLLWLAIDAERALPLVSDKD
ncbi:MFS transporter [Mucilaginibacter sp.]|uniref:MFS transporter n=1 Tax=Mucilaginibacter sp. TaxID=1882438 RepID=UPI0026305B27|nr:MFS transporter [Mucilaginibacter sp.]MDB4926327.1 transporter [Mucilaginibacter sp.]